MFERILPLILKIEGPYSNRKADRGGPTNFGITHTTYDAFRDSVGLPRRTVRAISELEVREIYRRDYWRPLSAEKMPAKVACVVMDGAVHSGVKRASKFLQRILGVPADGAIGEQTLAALRGKSDALIAKQFLQARRDHFKRLIEEDPSQKENEKGWENRLVAVEKFLQTLTS